MRLNISAFCLVRCLVLISAAAAFSAANGQLARPAAPIITEISSSSDTIGERAAWNLEQQRLKNNPPPAASSGPIGVIPMAAQNTQRAGSAPDFALTGIRGFVGALEGSFLINGKRAAGSVRYPTLVDGWKVADISSAGAVIERNRERKQLPFSGSSPYQEKPPQPATATPASPMFAPMNGFGGQAPMMTPPQGFAPPAVGSAIPVTPGNAVPAIR